MHTDNANISENADADSLEAWSPAMFLPFPLKALAGEPRMKEVASPPGCRFPGPCGPSPKVSRRDLSLLRSVIHSRPRGLILSCFILSSATAATSSAAPSNFESGHADFEPYLFRDLTFELLE